MVSPPVNPPVKPRRWLRAFSLVFGLTGLMIAGAVQGCSFLDEDPPGRHCASNPDCFITQGETCDLTTNTCKSRAVVIDAGPMGVD